MQGAKTIMLQGTASNVGKSVLCTALCRIFYQEGYKTAPFKAQNMALNSMVTPDGGEIGRAQGVQAEAAGILPTVDMNPILIKPKQDMEAQIVVRGRPIGDLSAKAYRRDFLPSAAELVAGSLKRLKEEYEVLVIEGAGSPAEVNLKDNDVVNMKTAELAGAPVVLVADWDKGGAVASLVGTMALLEPAERERVKGFILNKFRGDREILDRAVTLLEERTGVAVLGVVPFLPDHGIDEEDSVCLEDFRHREKPEAPIQIAVIQLPRISNFTDINPFLQLPDTGIRMIPRGQPIGPVDAVIIPGTKNSILDLLYLKEQGYAAEITELARQGKLVIGICGGYQMLGERLEDPYGTEAGIGSQDGLGLLPCITVYGPDKNTFQVEAAIRTGRGLWATLQGKQVKGYEIHMGQTRLADGFEPFLEITRRSGRPVCVADGACNETGNVIGTHLHGFFDNPEVLFAVANYLRTQKGLRPLAPADLPSYRREMNYDRLAQVVRETVNMSRLKEIMGL